MSKKRKVHFRDTHSGAYTYCWRLLWKDGVKDCQVLHTDDWMKVTCKKCEYSPL